MKSIDYTNYRYGRSTLSLANAGLKKKWSMRRKYSSKIDTADFYRLPTIKASWNYQCLKYYPKIFWTDLNFHGLKARLL